MANESKETLLDYCGGQIVVYETKVGQWSDSESILKQMCQDFLMWLNVARERKIEVKDESKIIGFSRWMNDGIIS